MQAAALTVPDDGRSRLHERRERVERPLRTYLLEDPDRRVGDDHTEKQGVARVAEREHSTPNTTRIRLKIVKTFARTMLA